MPKPTDHNIDTPELRYAGSDPHLDGQLSRWASSQSIPYRGPATKKNPARQDSAQQPTPEPPRQCLLFFDLEPHQNQTDTRKADQQGPDLLESLSQAALAVAVLKEPADNWQTLPRLVRRHVGDSLIIPLPEEALNKRLDLYLDYLRSLTAPAGQANNRLRQQINQLRRQLLQIDLDLTVQNSVLDKISQISFLSRQINCLDLDKIASVCIEKIPELISARYASLYRFDQQQQVFHLLRHNHPYPIERMVLVAEHPCSPMALAAAQRRLLLISDFNLVEQGGDLLIQRAYASQYNSNSCIIAPLLSGDQVLGVLNLADKTDGAYFDEAADQPPIELLCEIIGSAMSNIQLYEEVRQQARTDSMTGLLNYRAFYDRLDKEVQRCRRYGGPLSLVMIDLDNLKEANSQYGHRAGDAVVMHVAQEINSCTRQIDVAARYGGDEFAIILPNTQLAAALVVARRLSEMVRSQPVHVGEDEIEVSVSIGVGQYQPECTIEDFVNAADMALFESKSAGKNRVSTFESALRSTSGAQDCK